jgi:hypothetical protein
MPQAIDPQSKTYIRRSEHPFNVVRELLLDVVAPERPA